MALFNNDHKALPSLLQGRILHAGGRRFTISQAQGFSRAENDAPLYRPILPLTPGSIYCPRRRNTILFLIACLDGGSQGGCVLIRELLEIGGMISGPAAVSAVLGISQPKVTGRIVELSNGELRLELDSQPGKSAPAKKQAGKKPVKDNGIGDATLKRLMPRITRTYLAQGQGKTFQVFLEDLLGRCKTEAALRQALEK